MLNLKGHCNQIYQGYFSDEKLCYSYNTADLNRQARIHPVVYYQHFYLFKCAFLPQTGSIWVRLDTCVYTSSKEAVLAVLFCIDRAVALSVYSLH